TSGRKRVSIAPQALPAEAPLPCISASAGRFLTAGTRLLSSAPVRRPSTTPCRAVLLSLAMSAGAPGCTTSEKTPGPEPIRLPPVKLPVGDTQPLGLVVITVDTLRADYLSCYGHARILTPSIDRLA